jgi:NAD(P)-dependent dehydrogenase (short-subunit alcohol dehydrogenase family)
MGRLSGKRALIAGAGGLLGSDLARGFAAEGADLILTTRTAEKLEPLAAEIRALGVRAATIASDFTLEDDCDHLADAAWRAFGGIDIVLFSSQPANPHLGDLLTTSEESWRDQQKSIVWGPVPYHACPGPRMMAAGGGSIITLTSSTGSEPVPGYGAYGLAKAALWTMTLYMAAEWGKFGIRGNALQPGLIATGDNAAQLEEAARKNGTLGHTALNRVGRNSECLGAAIYLASDESSFTTGQCIKVNGGRL